ncbi:MAG: response regulator [Hydrogenophaga sp.]|uniref:response regulator n=1 Tax=Hydrogenophaga sp. TaxID=1904254 RepID=UPI00261F7E8C|nr:response regulator [Hydrogenophaga sp.]MDM7942378.1 response regulator [Hydrogenophaga sp.]
MNTSTQEDYCGTFLAAKLLGLSVGTIQGLVEKNELHAWKTQGGHRRISMQSIRDYQRQHGMTEASDKTRYLKVLVVEDDAAMLEVFKSTIDGWTLPVDCSLMSSAMEALIDIHTIKPDLLITDLKMPGVDGFELLRTLRANPAFSSMVLVAMTGLSAEEIAERGGLPAQAVTIQKPVDMRWLQGFLAALVAIRQL